MKLNPKTLRSGNSLGGLDIAIRKPGIKYPPTEITMAYIEQGEGKIAMGLPGMPDSFEYQYSIGLATQVAIEYDAKWEFLLDDTARMFTMGDPWIFYVDTLGNLKAIKGQSSTVYNLAEGPITSICALRGWKHMSEYDKDQGLLIFYVRDGKVYYKALIEDASGNKIFQQEAELTTLGSGIIAVKAFRTNDYRVAIIGNTSTESRISITARCWVGSSTRSTDILYMGSGKNIAIKDTPIKNTTVKYEETDIIFIGPGNAKTTPKYTGQVSYVYAYNLSETQIEIHFNTNLHYTDLLALKQGFRLKDSKNISYGIKDLQQGSFSWLLTLDKFNNAVGDITIAYESNNAILGEAGQIINSFSYHFTPTGLIPDIPDPPIVESIINVEEDA